MIKYFGTGRLMIRTIENGFLVSGMVSEKTEVDEYNELLEEKPDDDMYTSLKSVSDSMGGVLDDTILKNLVAAIRVITSKEQQGRGVSEFKNFSLFFDSPDKFNEFSKDLLTNQELSKYFPNGISPCPTNFLVPPLQMLEDSSEG